MGVDRMMKIMWRAVGIVVMATITVAYSPAPQQLADGTVPTAIASDTSQLAASQIVPSEQSPTVNQLKEGTAKDGASHVENDPMASQGVQNNVAATKPGGVVPSCKNLNPMEVIQCVDLRFDRSKDGILSFTKLTGEGKCASNPDVTDECPNVPANYTQEDLDTCTSWKRTGGKWAKDYVHDCTFGAVNYNEIMKGHQYGTHHITNITSPSVAPVTEAHAEMIFAMDISAIYAPSSLHTQKLVADGIAGLIGIPALLVRIDSIESGSVRVKFTITGADASALRAKLKAKVDAGGITAVGPIQAKPICMMLARAPRLQGPPMLPSHTGRCPICFGQMFIP